MGSGDIQETLDRIYREDGPKILSTLIRLVSDFDLAEDSMQAAFATAAQQWSHDGVPKNPQSWLISTGRFKAIDSIRRQARVFSSLHELVELRTADTDPFPTVDEHEIEDDRLRLIFACCHPAIPDEGQMALTLREVCGLTNEEIAKAFLATPTTIAQRIVRAKAKIREGKIPYEIPAADQLAERTGTVLRVIYLVFNEGYYASSGETLTRQILCDEAIRIGKLLIQFLPDPEVFGLLGLMLLQEARRGARTTASGDVILLADQDTRLWNSSMILEGLDYVAQAVATPFPRSYGLHATIVATHVQGALTGKTDWDRIVGIYELLFESEPSAVVALNRAVAVAMRDGSEVGLSLVDEIISDLKDYGLAHSTRADLLRRLGRFEEAREAYMRALGLTKQSAEQRFLERRIAEVGSSLASSTIQT